ncbi:MAG: hypothetical protein MUE95_09550, partial [Cyclobacteriaceae bacterium]|nr:hypothetical protein [Cyclobacteriaceae bacterium]
KRIYTHPRILPTSKISGTLINDSIVADGSIIHASKIDRSVIGVRSRIGKESALIRTYMMGNDYYETLAEIAAKPGEIPMGVGEGCHIENAILDKNCRIGNNVKIIGGPHLPNQETDLFVVSNGIVVVKKEATIPHGFELN